jgi:hypothetical protein
MKLVTEENVRELDSWTGSRRSCGRALGEKMVNSTFEKEGKSIFKLEICVAKWDVLMKGYFVKDPGVVSSGS